MTPAMETWLADEAPHMSGQVWILQWRGPTMAVSAFETYKTEESVALALERLSRFHKGHVLRPNGQPTAYKMPCKFKETEG